MEIPNSQRYLREEYTARVNRVIDYIQANIVQELSLKELANIAGFSPFHFHRIFSALVGETLHGFIQRLRIEKAAWALVQNPSKPITSIAFDCGFSGASTFAREFRNNFGMSASEWRSSGHLKDDKNHKKHRKIRQSNRNTWQDFYLHSDYSIKLNRQTWRIETKPDKKLIADIEVKDIPEMHVAYLRNIGPYDGDMLLYGSLLNKLYAWAGPRGLLQFPKTKFITIYHDNPDITDDERLRKDICITVSPDTQGDGEIGKAVIPPGKNAIAHLETNPDQFRKVWNVVYSVWLPESGYQPDDRPCFELYMDYPKDNPQGKYSIDICVPIKPL